MTQIGRMAGSN